jgi:Xaa-Pro aminopeptidase
MKSMNYLSRLTNLRRTFKKHRCDALVIGHRSNLQYLCGFTGTAGMAIVLPDAAFFLTDFRYQAQAAQQVPSEYSVVIAKKGLWQEAAKVLRKKAARVGFEAEHTSVATFEEIQKLLAPAAAVSTFRAVEVLRERKDDDELAILRRAIQIADATFAHLCGILRPGLTEREISLEIEAHMKSQGASGVSFESIVASGARGALPHGVASDKVLQPGEMVTIDMGARYEGYCSDMTRTVCIGKPTREQQKVYEIVWRAQTEAAAQFRPGLGCKAADKIARDIIEAAGYGEYFGHGLGHGVGLQIHEQPRVSPLGKGKLQVGNVVSCEPGIYLPDWGGVRIEDLVLITPDGSEVLCKARKPKKILVL